MPQGKLILNHQPRNKEQQKTLSPVIRFMVGDYLCSASHVGNGILLTAYHCVQRIVDAPEGEKPAISLHSPGFWWSVGDTKNYTISAPPEEAREALPVKEGAKPEFVRVPDLAIVKVSGLAGTRLAGLPSIELGTETLKAGETDLVIAGYGKDGFGTIAVFGPFAVFQEPNTGILNSGGAQIESVGDYAYKLVKKEGDGRSAALPGDSGGPLIKVNADGKLVTYAVVSTLGTKLEGEEGEESVVLTNAYMRLDREPVKKWLAEAMKK